MNQLTMETPIGSLIFSVNISEGDISQIDILKCNVEPIIPKGMNVIGCKAVLLRCQSVTSLKDVVFSCSWNDMKETGCGNSGEGLDAWEWEYNKILVMVGTEDDEYLGSRVKLKKSTSSYYPITMHDNVITIHINEFPASHELTLHFVIAWNSLPEEVDSSCWYAVDIPHKKVLEICKQS